MDKLNRPKPKPTTLLIKLDKSLKKDFEIKCKKKGVSMSAVIRYLIYKYVHHDLFEVKKDDKINTDRSNTDNTDNLKYIINRIGFWE